MARRDYFLTGSAAPAITPEFAGSIFVDTTGGRIYFATGTSSSSDWDLMPVNINEITINADINFQGVRKAINLLGMDFQSSTELTINAGVIAPTQTWQTVDTEADAAADDLDTITAATDCNFLVLQLEDNLRVVTLKHNTGNMQLPNSSDIIMAPNALYILMYDGNDWRLSFS